jgi:anti-anti-sigma factor
MSTSTAVLLVDDDRDDYLLTLELLGEIDGGTYSLSWVDNYEEGVAALLSGGIELCLLDYFLGPRTGLELLRDVTGRGCTIPIVLLTGQSERELDVEAMKAGAADYLVKGEFGPRQLERSIRYSIERSRSIAALRELNAELQHARGQAQAVEAIRQQNASLDRLTTELEAARRTAEVRAHELAASNDRLHERERENQALIVRLREVVTQLSTPLLRVWHDVLALPIVGRLDEERATAITARTLHEITAQRVRHVALDLTGIEDVDAQTLEHLLALARATRLLGVQCFVCGLRPAVARTMVEFGMQLHGFECVRDLHEALAVIASRRTAVSGA